MRSRPDLRVYVEPLKPTPGERLHVRVCLDSHSLTPYNSVDVLFTGREKRYKYTSSNGKTSTAHYHRRDIVNLGAKFDGGMLAKGPWEESVVVDLPGDLPPSYKSNLSTIEYELSVRVDIPWWPDRTGLYAIPIQIPNAPPKKPKACLYANQQGENRDGEPTLEMSLDNERLSLGGRVEGAIAISDLGKRKLRRVEICLIAIETPLVESAKGPTEVSQYTWKIFDGTPQNGQSIPFVLKVPDDAPPTFQSPFIRVDHYLEAKAVVAFGSDVTLRIPTFICRGKTSKNDRSENKALPVVGHQRQLAVWQAAVTQTQVPTDVQLRLDSSSPTVRLDVHDVAIQIREEVRNDVGPCLVASLTYPSLGLQLRLAERRWTEFGSSFEKLDKKLQKRFTISAREEAQVISLLNIHFSKALRSFHEVGLNDETAVVMYKGGVHQVTGLVRFITRVYELAQQLRMASKDLPPPQSLADAFSAYQQFAEPRGIPLRRGDCALLQWTVRGVPLTLEHRWTGAKPIETCLWTAKPPEGHALDARWKQTLETLNQGRPVEEDERFGLALPLVHDPAALNDLYEQFATTVLKLSGIKTSAYR